MKKVLVVLLVVALAVALIVCLNRIHELERDYTDLETQVCNYMTGRAHGIRVEHEDEIQYWVHKNRETLFTEKASLICYER